MTDTRNYLDPAYGPVVPMIPKARLDQMLDLAITHKQEKPILSSRRISLAWSGGLATAVCLILVIGFTLLGYEPASDDRDLFDDPSLEVSELILAEAIDDF